MRTAAPRRAAAALVALSALACSRDLDLPDSTPPRIDAVAVVGLEPQAVTSDLPVLGGELVAIRGGGFPSDAAELEVRIGSEDAEVLDVSADRIVARVPALAAFGPADLQVRTPEGFRSLDGAFRYDGAGQPSGFGSSDLDTRVDLAFVAPVEPPGSFGVSDLAIATGASDSALLVVPSVNLAVATVPLGLVPSSAAAWIDEDPIVLAARLNVLAVGRGGQASLATAILDGSGASIGARAVTKPLAVDALLAPAPCTLPQVISTYYGTPVATWAEGAQEEQHKLATVDAAAAHLGTLAPAGAIHALADPVVGWGPSGASSIVFAARSEIYSYDAAAPLAAPQPLAISKGGLGPPVRVSTLIAPSGTPGCPSGIERIYTLATATTRPTDSAVNRDALAVAYRAGNADRVALVDLGDGTVWSGLAGTIPTSLSLVPDPPFVTSASPTTWTVLAGGVTNLYRFRALPVGPACGDLVPEAALPLTDTPGYLPGFGGMTAAADGTRLLTTTPDGDLLTVLPPSLTNAGSVVRFASYAGVSIQQASIGGAQVPIAIAEHSSHESSISNLDTGSALLVVSLAADRGAVALGGSGFGRGAVWLDPPGGGALAYTGDLRAAGTGVVERGGVAAVTGVAAGTCPGEDVRITASRPVTRGPDLVVQGPARSGALGPEGIARFGPADPPIYTVKDQALHLYLPDPAKLACLAGEDGAPDWDPTVPGSCAPDDTIALGVEPLDVTLSAGDRAAAIRTLQPWTDATICRPGDEVCQRANSLPERQVLIVQADPDAPATTAVALPAPPESVAADRGGGFLVTMRCEGASVAGGDRCFSSDPLDLLCDEYLTAPGGENGALVLVAEDGSGAACLAVQPGLAGPVAVTPNGAEAWVSGTTSAGQLLVRLGLPRRTGDGAVDPTRPADLVALETLYEAPAGGGVPPPGGVAFTPDGATAIVTVPAQYRILLRE